MPVSVIHDETHAQLNSLAGLLLALLALKDTGLLVHWMRQAGADWNRYAAELSRTRVHQHGE